MAQPNAITAQGGSYSAGVISFYQHDPSSRQAQTFNFSYTAPLSGGANTLSAPLSPVRSRIAAMEKLA
jgi:hypothetical protein